MQPDGIKFKVNVHPFKLIGIYWNKDLPVSLGHGQVESKLLT